MKIKKLINWAGMCLTMLYGLMVFSGCSRKDDLTNQVANLNWPADGNTALDKWLNEHFLMPYNIQIRYKWERARLAVGANVVPVKEEQIIPVCTTILEAFIYPYQSVADSGFMQTYAPKEFFLAGSVKYNSNGSVLLGVAEGGRSVPLYDLNNFDLDDHSSLIRAMHTVHHEFTHIVNQNIMFGSDYSLLSAGFYNGDWTNQSLQTALNGGFVTPYSMSDPKEDFAEMTSTLLVEGQDYFDDLVSSANNTGAPILQQKEQLVIDYFKNSWHIDFKKLQGLVQDAIYANAMDVEDFLGENMKYSSLEIDSTDIPTAQWAKPFLDAVKACEVDEEGKDKLSTSTITLIFDERGKLKLQTRLDNATRKEFYISDFLFEMTEGSNGIISFKYSGPNEASTQRYGFGNAQEFEKLYQPLIRYFQDHSFKFTWPIKYPTTKAKLVVQGDDANFVFGYLGNTTD